ncbi:rhodanese-like domain-containing protein [bacterium]|mgnify:CR=1 FL=1|jgi:phage shock protein E|nr:rhodanese-like domain-containing protein [bacterium]
MKIMRYRELLLLMLVLAMFGCQPSKPPVATTPDGTEPSKTQPANEDIANQGDSPAAASKEFLIDVRSQEEWDSGHLNDAVWIPHTEISERIAEVTQDKSAKLVLY